ncbi:MAG: GSU3473 family protein [Desulfuromonadales bacterium]
MSEQSSLRIQGQKPIEIIMTDGSQLQVTPKVLDVLIESNRVTKFKRSSGWVTIGVDPIRCTHRVDNSYLYDGPEKRAPL